jgi:hypothetical protein
LPSPAGKAQSEIAVSANRTDDPSRLPGKPNGSLSSFPENWPDPAREISRTQMTSAPLSDGKFTFRNKPEEKLFDPVDATDNALGKVTRADAIAEFIRLSTGL